MRIVRSPWLPRAGLAVLIGTAALVAWREGGGADPRRPPPQPIAASATRDEPNRKGAGEAYEVAARLIDALGDARIDAPSLGAAQPSFTSYWRKLRGPWARPFGVAGQLVTTLALRTGGEEETQLSVKTKDGGSWTPDARIWNMNEGSYEQREAIFAPTPATLAFRVTMPPRARLRFSTAVATPPAVATGFAVLIVDAGGVERTVSETHVAAGGAPGWRDVDVDLSPWGEQKVELRLRTSAERASEGAAAQAPAPSLALWGNPVVVAPRPTRLPYDVLWIVVDALRPDVAAALHDPDEDAAKLAAPRPPLEALLPAIPGLMPNVDRLAARGVHFTHAWSAGVWTRPGTLAMLSGARSSELGIDPTVWLLSAEQTARYYASNPPLLPLVLRKNGVSTAAFVNNFFLSGYVAVGVDMGFDRVTDHRYRTRDTDEITRDATAWLDAHARDRFFLFVNYNSPHQPLDPPREMLARIPEAPAGPAELQVRQYMAEGAKDDAAIGKLLEKIDALGLTRTTLVVVTSDHGETLSSAHTGFGLGRIPLRFHHAVGNFEETARIPIVMALPGILDGGRAVADRVRSIDIAPTVLDAEGLEADSRMSGRSLLPLVQGRGAQEPRVVVNEGRGSRAILWGPWRLIVHEPVALAPNEPEPPPDQRPIVEDELFNLGADPGERHNVAKLHADVVDDLKARLSAALANVQSADAPRTASPGSLPTTHWRFAGAGRTRRVKGEITVGDGRHPAAVVVDPSGIARETLRITRPPDATPEAKVTLDFALTTLPDALVGFDVRVDPPGAPIGWQLSLDDEAWPDDAAFAGPFGLPAVASKGAIASDEARAEVYSPAIANVDPARDLGVFVTRDRPGETGAGGPAVALGDDGAAMREAQRMLEQWGYARGRSHDVKKERSPR